MVQGQIYKIHSDFYYAASGEEIFECKIREVLKKQKEKILVGDYVEFENGHITKILPRKNYIKRPSVANIDQIIIVSALKEPDLDLHQLNRYIALAKYYNIPTVLCFNKEDLKWDKHIKSDIKTDMVTDGFLSQDAYDVIKTYNRVLATEAFANMQPNEIKTVTMKATKLLANNDGDLAFDNDIEVNTLKGSKMEYVLTDPSQINSNEKDEYVYATPGDYIPGTGPKVQSDDDMKVLVITGPTGENNNYLPYILLGISSFIILGTGIIFIKKKVL